MFQSASIAHLEQSGVGFLSSAIENIGFSGLK
jgi:hypothetical protein